MRRRIGIRFMHGGLHAQASAYVMLLAGLIALAGALALVPLPPAAVEQWYSAGVFPPLQAGLTSISNLVPFALLDVMIVGLLLCGLWLFLGDLRRRPGVLTLLGRWCRRVVALAAVLYVAFVLLWGLNYRRLPLAERLVRSEAGASVEATRRLVLRAVEEVNRLHAAAHAPGAFAASGVDVALARSFQQAQRAIGLTRTAVPARPKRTLLDPYYRAAAVAGMTNPFFLETLVVSDLLPVERPLVIAHEWSHLAGINDEGEANFLAWLTGVTGSAAAQYSAWLFMYQEAVPSIPRKEHDALARRLGPGPRDDLRAIAERHARNVRPAVASAGWQVYDRYLKANRIEAGAASYSQVVRLVLEARFKPGWTPILAK